MKFKIDISDLQRGDVIETATCEGLIGESFGTLEFAKRQLYLCKQIEAELWKIGRQITCIIRGGEIRLLTDIESSEYNQGLYESGKRKIRLAHRRALAVDMSKLSDDKRKNHLEAVCKMASVISGFRYRKPLVANTAGNVKLPARR